MAEDKKASGTVANDRKGESVEVKPSFTETLRVRIPLRPPTANFAWRSQGYKWLKRRV